MCIRDSSFFTPYIGVTKSTKKTKTATERVIKTNFKLKGTASVKFKISIPNQDVIGPGITGKKLPTMPVKHKIIPMTKIKMSIRLY